MKAFAELLSIQSGQRTQLSLGGFRATLPRGERLANICFTSIPLLFLSTLPRGERRKAARKAAARRRFLSTLPRGERRQRRRCQTHSSSFYPRSRAGSDSKYGI